MDPAAIQSSGIAPVTMANPAYEAIMLRRKPGDSTSVQKTAKGASIIHARLVL